MVVDFWASRRGPRLAMAPAYKRAAAELKPGFRLLKVNADDKQQLMARFRIRGIPTFILSANGHPVAQDARAINTRDIMAWAQSRVSK